MYRLISFCPENITILLLRFTQYVCSFPNNGHTRGRTLRVSRYSRVVTTKSSVDSLSQFYFSRRTRRAVARKQTRGDAVKIYDNYTGRNIDRGVISYTRSGN